MSWPELPDFEACCAYCKPILDPGRRFSIAISKKWKPCVRCAVRTTYRLRPAKA